MKQLLLVVAISFLGASAFSAECISQKEMSEIASHFSQFSNLARKEFCYDGSQTSNLLASLMFMRKTAFAADMKPSQDELFSGRFSQSWYNYFIGRIDDMNVQTSCPKGVGAYVYGWGSTMYVCPMMLTDSFSSLDRASVFMHEARHIDGYPHTTCSQGPRKGISGACDESISDGGSYAVTVETYAQLAKYATDLHPALRTYSLASAVTYADEAFDAPVRVERDAELLLMAQSKAFYSLSLNGGKAEIKELGQSPALGHIVSRAQHLILFPEDKNLEAKYVFAKNEGDLGQAAGEAAVEYNSQTPEQRAQLVDLHIGGQWSAKIYPNKIKFACDPRSAAASELSLSGGATAVGIMYLNGYDRAARMGYLMTSTGAVQEFGCTENARPFLRASTAKVDQKFKRIHKVGDYLVGLTFNGELFAIKGSQVTPIATEAGAIFEIAPRQSYLFMDSK